VNVKGRDLPVDPVRLKAQFPALTDDDVAAYQDVTRRILAADSSDERARITRETLSLGRSAREKRAAGAALAATEEAALRYLDAVDKMQSPRLGIDAWGKRGRA
jgi:hypothetical protein